MLYLYEILEDYQFATTDAEKEEIFSSFCQKIWEHPNQRTITEKPITFRIKPTLLKTEIGEVFSNYTSIPRNVCPSTTKNTGFASLIRQKLNNIYTYFFDENICSRKEYLDLLRLPKKLYFQWESFLGKGEPEWILSPKELSNTLEQAMADAKRLKETCAREKMKLSWEEYKQVAEGYFRRLFEHYQPLEEYQTDHALVLQTGTWNEDNFCISYFCSGLHGYFKNYQKSYYGLYNANSRRKTSYSRCACGNLFLQNRQRNRRLCDTCRKQSRSQSYSRYNEKRKTQLPHS